MTDEFIAAPEADARWPGRRKLGAKFFVDTEGNRWERVSAPAEGSFERIEGYRRRGKRVSTDQSDPGYTANPNAFRVSFAGKDVEYWVTADDTEGLLVTYAFRGSKVVFAADDPDRALAQEHRGVVEIMRVAE